MLAHKDTLKAICGACVLLLLMLLLSSTDDVEQERLELLLGRTVAVLEDAGVTYWISGGTLIGAFRVARVVPGDFDADLDVPVESLAALRGIDWAAAGLLCYEGYGGYRVKSRRLDTLRVDIFVRRTVDNIIVYGWPHLDSAYEKTLTHEALVFPLRRYKMSTYTVYGPAEPHIMLQHQYGNYTVNPPRSWTEAAWVCFEKQVWARIIPVASVFSPAMPY